MNTSDKSGSAGKHTPGFELHLERRSDEQALVRLNIGNLSFGIGQPRNGLEAASVMRTFREALLGLLRVNAHDDLVEKAQAYRDAQDALDNREYAGINAEPYDVLMRRRNAARDDLDAAIAKATGSAA